MPKLKTEFGWGFRSFRILQPDMETVIFRGYTLDLGVFAVGFHVFEQADDAGFFHTHSGWAFRWVLWGGYVEEVVRDRSDWLGLCADQILRKRWFFPGRFGFVAPSMEHRIDRLLFGKRSVSLWIRGPVVAEIQTRYIPEAIDYWKEEDNG